MKFEFINILFLLGFITFHHTQISAQNRSSKFDTRMVLTVKESSSSRLIEDGGIYYENEKIDLDLVFDEKSWDKGLRHITILTFTEGVNSLFTIFPSKQEEGEFTRQNNSQFFDKYNIFRNATVAAPFGKDKYVLLITEKPIPLSLDILRSSTETRSSVNWLNELILLTKGSKLSKFYDIGLGEIIIKTLQVEARPFAEKAGLLKDKGTGIAKAPERKTVFIINDSSEIFYTPLAQENIVRDDFPVIDIIDPQITRGIELPSGTDKKILIRGIAADRQNGIRNVTFNNSPATVYRETSGYFDYLYELKEGLNIIYISVENNKGFKRSIRLKFNYTSHEEKLSSEGRNYLMVIGVNSYTNLPVLYNAKKDATDFKQLMIEKFGYQKENIVEIYDAGATRKSIYNQLKKFVDSLEKNDRLLIYYAGHGLYDKKLDMGFWLPVNAAENEYDDYLGNPDITRYIQKMSAKNIFVIADACYSGSLLRDMQKENGHDYKSRMVLCSGKLQPVADGDPGTNSPFAQKVFEFFKNAKDKQILASDLIQYVKKSFISNTNQKPVGGAIDEVGDENGDFIFERRN